MEEILAHPWMKLDTVTKEEIKEEFVMRQAVIDTEAKRERELKREERREAETLRRIFRSSGNEDDGEGYDDNN